MHHLQLSKTWLCCGFMSSQSSLPYTAFLPNCLCGQDLDQRFLIWRIRELQIICQCRLMIIITQTLTSWCTEGKGRLCSQWWSCGGAKVIKWFSTELRLSETICQTEEKQPGLKMEFIANRLPNPYLAIPYVEAVANNCLAVFMIICFQSSEKKLNNPCRIPC